jgi:leucine dehydrogenase
MGGYDQKRALRLTRQIYGRLRHVFDLSRELNVPTSVAADRIAEERLGALTNSGAATRAA